MTRAWTGGIGFETILECSGVAENFTLAFDLVANGGALCMISIMFKSITLGQPMTMNFKEFRFTGSYSNTHEENRRCLAWMAEGAIDARPLISEVITACGAAPGLSGAHPPGKGPESDGDNRRRILRPPAVRASVNTGAAATMKEIHP